MIVLLLSWLYYSFLFFVYGLAGEAFINRLFVKKGNQKNEISLFILPWLGIALLAFMVSVFSIFYRVNWECNFVCLFIALLFVTFNFSNVWSRFKILSWVLRKQSVIFFVFSAALIFWIAFSGTDGPVYNLDPGRYQFQSILWDKTFPVVKGLANLHDRFGHNSSWFLIHSMADFSVLNERSFHVFNSLIFVYLTIYCLYCFLQLSKGKYALKYGFGTAILIFVLYYYQYIYFWYLSCPNADLPVNIFSIIIFFVMIDYFDARVSDKERFMAGLVLMGILSIAAFSFKASGIYLVVPLSGYVIYYFYKYKREAIASALKFKALMLIYIFPSLYRNVILTGWILFPLPQFDFFNVDWKLSKECLDGMLKQIRYTGFFTGLEEHDLNSMNEIIDTPRYILFSRWILFQFKSGGYIYWVISGVVFYIISLTKKNRESSRKSYFPLIISAIGLLTISLFSTTEFRYSWSFVSIVFAVFTAILIDSSASVNLFLRTGKLMIICFAFFFIVKVVFTSTSISIRQNHIKYPVVLSKYLLKEIDWFNLSEVPKSRYKSVPFGDIKFNVAERDTSYVKNGRNPAFVCVHYDVMTTDSLGHLGSDPMAHYNAFVGNMNWMTALPATGAVPEGLTLRGKTIEEGFKIVN